MAERLKSGLQISGEQSDGRSYVEPNLRLASHQRPPSAKWRPQLVKMCIFLEEFDPFRQLHLAGGGGVPGEKKLGSPVLLALRQFPPLAGRGGAYSICCVRGYM